MKTYKIQSIHNVYIDSYTQGELDNVNNYDLSNTIKADTPKQAIVKYFKNFLHYSFDFENAQTIEEQNTLHYSNIVDNDNIEANKTDLEEWKQGNKTLFSNNITLWLYELNQIDINKL